MVTPREKVAAALAAVHQHENLLLSEAANVIRCIRSGYGIDDGDFALIEFSPKDMTNDERLFATGSDLTRFVASPQGYVRFVAQMKFDDVNEPYRFELDVRVTADTSGTNVVALKKVFQFNSRSSEKFLEEFSDEMAKTLRYDNFHGL